VAFDRMLQLLKARRRKRVKATSNLASFYRHANVSRFLVAPDYVRQQQHRHIFRNGIISELSLSPHLSLPLSAGKVRTRVARNAATTRERKRRG
jgi:hypothetical protein